MRAIVVERPLVLPSCPIRSNPVRWPPFNNSIFLTFFMIICASMLSINLNLYARRFFSSFSFGIKNVSKRCLHFLLLNIFLTFLYVYLCVKCSFYIFILGAFSSVLLFFVYRFSLARGVNA